MGEGHIRLAGANNSHIIVDIQSSTQPSSFNDLQQRHPDHGVPGHGGRQLLLRPALRVNRPLRQHHVPGDSNTLDRDKLAKGVQINHTRLDYFILGQYGYKYFV